MASSEVRVRVLSRGAQALLKDPGVQADIGERVDRVANAAGEGFEGDVQLGKRRTVGMIKTMTDEAAKKNAEESTLLIALNRGQ